MVWRRILIVLGIIALLGLSSMRSVYGIPSGGVYPPVFRLRNGEWLDSFGFRRDYYGGSNGFFPNVAYESLGPDRERAYSIGERLKANYPVRTERAEAVLKYVQRWTEYGYDEDNVVMGGESQPEWAWNADEMAHVFNENTGSVAIGDCEDMAILCSTIYTAAGFDAALVLTDSHVALLIWLPEYDNANSYWDVGDGRGEGWIWVEATGPNNPLGWTPPDFSDGNFEVTPLGFSTFTVALSPQDPQAEDAVTVTADIASARGTVSKVLLSYTIGDTKEVVQMTDSGSTFEAVIPGQSDGTTISGNVSATDSYGFTKNYDFEYTVGQGQSLEISPLLLEVGIGVLFVIILLVLMKRSRK
jgi:hypothetical protein